MKNFQPNTNQFYGGWCAFAMGDYGEKVEINPNTFKVIDGKLISFTINYLPTPSLLGTRTRKTEEKQANQNWEN